jgi:hypothetical protein
MLVLAAPERDAGDQEKSQQRLPAEAPENRLGGQKRRDRARNIDQYDRQEDRPSDERHWKSSTRAHENSGW